MELFGYWIIFCFLYLPGIIIYKFIRNRLAHHPFFPIDPPRIRKPSGIPSTRPRAPSPSREVSIPWTPLEKLQVFTFVFQFGGLLFFEFCMLLVVPISLRWGEDEGDYTTEFYLLLNTLLILALLLEIILFTLSHLPSSSIQYLVIQLAKILYVRKECVSLLRVEGWDMMFFVLVVFAFPFLFGFGFGLLCYYLDWRGRGRGDVEDIEEGKGKGKGKDGD